MNDELHNELFVGTMAVTGKLIAYFPISRRKIKRFLNRKRKFEQKLRRLAFKRPTNGS